MKLGEAIRSVPGGRGTATARALALMLLIALFAGQAWAVQHIHADGDQAVCEVCSHVDHTPVTARDAAQLPEPAQAAAVTTATPAAAPHTARYQPHQSRAPPSQQN